MILDVPPNAQAPCDAHFEDAAHLPPIDDPSDPATARAAANIALWRSYLPEDCVTAMITAGWHWST
jgi:hypothetical protein